MSPLPLLVTTPSASTSAIDSSLVRKRREQVTSSRGAVGPVGDDLERDLSARRSSKTISAGVTSSRSNATGFVDPLGAVLDPADEHPVLPAVLLQPLAPLVGDRQRRLLEDLAPLGDLEVDPVGVVLQQRLVVHLEVVAEQREPEAALPLERAVAGAAVAAEPAQQREDVPLEVGTSSTSASRNRSFAGACVSAAESEAEKAIRKGTTRQKSGMPISGRASLAILT